MAEDRDNNEFTKVCYMCRRSESKAGPMVDMPGGICMCHDCLQKSIDQAVKMTGALPPEVQAELLRMSGAPVRRPEKQEVQSLILC